MVKVYEDLLMREPKEKLEKYLDSLITNIIDLNASLDLLRFLETTGKDEDSLQSWNTLPSLFSFVRNSSFNQIVLTLDRLLDLKGDRSVFWYLTQMKTHIGVFESDRRFSIGELDEHLNRINSLQEEIEKISRCRDKWVAHRDKAYFDNPDKFWDEISIKISDLARPVDVLKELADEHLMQLKDGEVEWTFLDDQERLFGILSKYRGLLKFLEEYDISRNKPDFLQKIDRAREILD